MRIDETNPVPGRIDEPHPNLIELLQASPLAKAIAEDGIDFEIDRSDDFDRDIDFGDSDDEA